MSLRDNYGIPQKKSIFERSVVVVDTGNGHGSTNTSIRRFSRILEQEGDAITYIDSEADGASFVINNDGLYCISYTDERAADRARFGISVNSDQLTTAIESITSTNRVQMSSTNIGPDNMCVIKPFRVGDILRPHTDSNTSSTSAAVKLVMTFLGPVA